MPIAVNVSPPSAHDIIDKVSPKVSKTSAEDFLSLLYGDDSALSSGTGGSGNTNHGDNKTLRKQNLLVAVDTQTPNAEIKAASVSVSVSKENPASQKTDLVTSEAPDSDPYELDHTSWQTEQRNDASQETPPATSSAKPSKIDDKSVSNQTSDPVVVAKSNDNTASKDTNEIDAINANDNEENVDDINQAIKNMRDDLEKQLADISQMVLAIIQALVGQSAAPAQSTEETDVTTDAAVLADVNSTSSTSNPEIALLKDIQSILQQMQQLLQATDDVSSETMTQTQPQNPLQSLVDALQTDIASLSQVLDEKKAKGEDLSLTLGSDTQDLGNLGDALKTGVADLKDRLQKLKLDSEAIFTPMKNSLQNQLAAMGQSFKDSLSYSMDGTLKDAVSVLPTVSMKVEAPVQNTSNAAQDPLASPVANGASGMNLSQNGNGGNQGNNSGNNGQNQASAQPVASAGLGQSQAGTNANTTTSFAKALNQTAQGNVLDQVMFQVKTAIKDGSSKIHIQLDPAELGKLDIKLHVQADGKTGVVVTVDNKDTLTLLQRDAQGLAKALNDAGLNADSSSLSFNLRNGGQEKEGNSQAALTYQKAQPDEEDPVEILSKSYVVNLAEGLDIRI